MKSFTFALIFVLFSVFGCSTVSKITTDDAKLSTLNPTNAELIKVFSKKDATGRSFKVIGQVVACADAGEDSQVTIDLLKNEAALLGADAIFDLNISFTIGYWTTGIKATGTAIKYE